jgi:WD40 repeat protein
MTLIVWEASTGKQLKNLRVESFVGSAIFSPDNQRLAIGNDNGHVILWDIAEGKQIRNLVGHTGAVTGLAFSEDGNLLASGSLDGTVVLWLNSLP